MKLSNLKKLLEMPQLVNKEMTIDSLTTNFYSQGTLKDNFDPIGNFDKNNENYFIYMSKNKSHAVIGVPYVRKEDMKGGILILCQVDFKKPSNLSYSESLDISTFNAIHVDGVQVTNKTNSRKGIGFLLYLGIIKAGYVLISDNVHYLGGKALWEKMIYMSGSFDFSVFVLENGEPIIDEFGNPIKFTKESITKEDSLFIAKKD